MYINVFCIIIEVHMCGSVCKTVSVDIHVYLIYVYKQYWKQNGHPCLSKSKNIGGAGCSTSFILSRIVASCILTFLVVQIAQVRTYRP